MKIAFFGTDEFSLKVLEALALRGIKPALVVTVPDKPKGRKLLLTPPPIKAWAEENNISVYQPESLKDQTVTDHLSSETYDLFIVASYGKIIPQTILDLPAAGVLNIHPSILPKYRGATPIETTILNGDSTSGVTIIKLDAQMDHGPIVAQTDVLLSGQETYPELRDQLAILGGQLLADNLPAYLKDKIDLREQDHQAASFSVKIQKIDGQIDLGKDNQATLWRKYRAFLIWPGLYFFIIHHDSKLRILIKKAHLADEKFIIDRVLPEGKKEMDWVSFEKGYLE